MTTLQFNRGYRVKLSCIESTAVLETNATAVGALQRTAAIIPSDDDIEAVGVGELLATDVAVILAAIDNLVNIISDLEARRVNIKAIL